MVAVAVMDVLSMLQPFRNEIVKFFYVVNICTSQNTVVIFAWSDTLLRCFWNYSRRCSTWLSYCITLIRTLVICNPMNPKFENLSKPKASYFVILGVLIFAAPIYVMDLLSFHVVVDNPGQQIYCDQLSNNVYYTSKFYRENDQIVNKVIRVIEGFQSKIIPCILFPITTFFLLRGIRDAKRRRRKLTSSSSNSDSMNASKLVLALTSTFFIAELPLGIMYSLTPFGTIKLNESNNTEQGFISMHIFMIPFDDLFNTVLIITTATHMVICVLMSSQYRQVAYVLIICGYAPKRKLKSNSVTVTVQATPS